VRHFIEVQRKAAKDSLEDGIALLSLPSKQILRGFCDRQRRVKPACHALKVLTRTICLNRADLTRAQNKEQTQITQAQPDYLT
jgi:hypothetical protein